MRCRSIPTSRLLERKSMPSRRFQLKTANLAGVSKKSSRVREFASTILIQPLGAFFKSAGAPVASVYLSPVKSPVRSSSSTYFRVHWQSPATCKLLKVEEIEALTRKRSLVRVQSCLPYLSMTCGRFSTSPHVIRVHKVPTSQNCLNSDSRWTQTSGPTSPRHC